MTMVKKAILGSALAASALVGVMPASAQWYGGYRGGYGYRGYHRGGDAAGVAAVAGIAGLAIGAAIASDRPRYVERRYYEPAPRVYYDAYPAYEYPAYPACHWERRYDPYYGPTNVRVCY